MDMLLGIPKTKRLKIALAVFVVFVILLIPVHAVEVSQPGTAPIVEDQVIRLASEEKNGNKFLKLWKGETGSQIVLPRTRSIRLLRILSG